MKEHYNENVVNFTHSVNIHHVSRVQIQAKGVCAVFPNSIFLPNIN